MEKSQNQLERLNFIEFRLFFAGQIGRADLTNRFGISDAAATRDLALYRKEVPENISYDQSNKIYYASENFERRYLKDIEAKRLLLAIVHGIGDDLAAPLQQVIPFELPVRLHAPNIESFAIISRAIFSRCPIQLSYISESGQSDRIIVPFSFAGNGLRWHVRAYDRKKGIFCDFVVNRITKAIVLKNEPILPHETKDNDIQWNRIVELELVPHPDLKNPKYVEREHNMRNGFLKYNVRAALAGYILRLWNVDCSKNHSYPKHRHLWLRNPEALYGVENAVLAPGYGE